MAALIRPLRTCANSIGMTASPASATIQRTGRIKRASSSPQRMLLVKLSPVIREVKRAGSISSTIFPLFTTCAQVYSPSLIKSAAEIPCPRANPSAAFVIFPFSSYARIEGRVFHFLIRLRVRSGSHDNSQPSRCGVNVHFSKAIRASSSLAPARTCICSTMPDIIFAGISSVPISKRRFLDIRVTSFQHGESQFLTFIQVRFRAHTRQISHPADILRPFRQRNRAARVKQIERMRTFQHIIISRQDIAFFNDAAASFSYMSNSLKSISWSDNS